MTSQTTTYPAPHEDDDAPHVYVSVGHQQMMTDPMKPLGLSVWRLTSRAPMREAGCRLFVDVTAQLSTEAGRAALVDGMLGRSDPLIGDALRTLVERDFVPLRPEADPAAGLPRWAAQEPVDPDPSIVPALVARIDASIAATEARIAPLSGPALLDAIAEDVAGMFDPQTLPVVMVGMEAVWWLNDHLEAWLGERSAADALIQSVPGDVTAEMALGLLDVADAIRPHPEVVAHLRAAPAAGFLDRLDACEGGVAARAALEAWLDRYGVRGVGEIDITRPRWRERPDLLAPVLLGHVEHHEPGEAGRRVERGLRTAQQRAAALLERLRELPDGEAKAAETETMIERARAFIGFREHPKFGIVRRYAAYKAAILGEARRLVAAGVLGEEEDAFFLSLEELREVSASGAPDPDLLVRRRAEFEAAHQLVPPRVLTSEGEGLGGSYAPDDRRPDGAIVGLGVSDGVVEGRARVVLDLADVDLEPGDVLVTRFTDPSWTPVFPLIAGLVTEVGGLMTHGAVVAREYGLPAVVGVEQATQRIPDGARVRVRGGEGWVELLDAPPAT